MFIPKTGEMIQIAYFFQTGGKFNHHHFRNHPLTFFCSKAGDDHLSLPELTAKLRSCGARADQADSIEELFEAWHMHTESWQRLEIFGICGKGDSIYILPDITIVVIHAVHFT